MNALVSTAEVANAIDAATPSSTARVGPRDTCAATTHATAAPPIAGPAITHLATGTRSRPPRGGTSYKNIASPPHITSAAPQSIGRTIRCWSNDRSEEHT